MNFRLWSTWQLFLLAEDPLVSFQDIGHNLLIPAGALVAPTTRSSLSRCMLPRSRAVRACQTHSHMCLLQEATQDEALYILDHPCHLTQEGSVTRWPLVSAGGGYVKSPDHLK